MRMLPDDPLQLALCLSPPLLAVFCGVPDFHNGFGCPEMTDNIGKHLFCPVWGAGYSGVIVAETAKTWLIKLPYRKREDRKRKTPGDILAPVGTDWKAACDAFDAAMRAYIDEITDAKTVLSHAQAKQKAAAIAALTGDETSLAIDASVKLEQDGGHL